MADKERLPSMFKDSRKTFFKKENKIKPIKDICPIAVDQGC